MELLCDLIKNAKNFPLEGVLNLDNIWNNVLNYNEKGIKNKIE